MLFNNSHKMLHTKFKFLTKMKSSIKKVDREIIFINMRPSFPSFHERGIKERVLVYK